MRLFFCTLVGVVLMTAGLSGCGGGGIQEGVEPNVDMTKDYSPSAKATLLVDKKPGKKKKADADANKAAPAGDTAK